MPKKSGLDVRTQPTIAPDECPKGQNKFSQLDFKKAAMPRVQTVNKDTASANLKFATKRSNC